MKTFQTSLIWKILLLIVIAFLARSFGNSDVGVKGISVRNTDIDTATMEF